MFIKYGNTFMMILESRYEHIAGPCELIRMSTGLSEFAHEHMDKLTNSEMTLYMYMLKSNNRTKYQTWYVHLGGCVISVKISYSICKF